MDVQNKKTISIVAGIDIGGEQPEEKITFPSEVGLLTTKNFIFFPSTMAPIMIGRAISKKFIKDAEKKHAIIGVVCQKDENVQVPTIDDVYPVGVFARVVKTIELPGDNFSAIIQAYKKFKVISAKGTSPIKAIVEPIEEEIPQNDLEFKMAIEAMNQKIEEYFSSTSDFPEDASLSLQGMKNPYHKLNFFCSTFTIPNSDKFKLLETDSVKKRVFMVLQLLSREIELQSIRNEIEEKTRTDLDLQQRNYFLQQQIKNLQAEIGPSADSPEIQELRMKAQQVKWPADNPKAEETFHKELDKLKYINPQSPDYTVLINYLQTLVALPWDKYDRQTISVKKAEKTLNHNHYGMEKVKERILEQIAVMMFQTKDKAPILCLYGPPGVGKTSLCKSIAEALGRKYVRVSLGGVHDESEIRGHRRTYIGAMPGQIIKGLQKAGSSSPVFVLDEIDKVGKNSINGDPYSALLEVLDPEQNNKFHDNYIDIDYDLSNVLFIATANELSTIPRPLLDRMELIEVGGYITEEKIEIAKRHLVPQLLDETGLKVCNIKFGKDAIETIIEKYTRESGVRQLKREIGKILRKYALMNVLGKEVNNKLAAATVVEMLGNPPFSRDIYQGNSYAGVVTGLAWTSVGGEILYIETSLSKGKGSKLTLTGNLGDVMKESAALAMEYVKAHADYLHIDYRIFDNWNIHIHAPEGATPKDGPSAGITIATSIASALTQRKVRDKVAMTGEITLRGKVLPVGGIKEKILAAKRAGITDIVLCKDNRKDIEEIPDIYLKGVTFHYVESVTDVWDFALTDEKADHPTDLTVDEKSDEKK